MNLRTLRTSYGLTQAQLAEKAKISRPMIAMIEGGKRGLTARLAVRVVAALQIPEAEQARVIGELVTEGANYAR